MNKTNLGLETLMGKTIEAVAFDPYDHFILSFTDGSVLLIKERSQSGQIDWTLEEEK